MPGADQVIPVDVYVPGCPPRPEQALDALILLQERIQRGEGHSQVVLKQEKGFDVPLATIRPTNARDGKSPGIDLVGHGRSVVAPSGSPGDQAKALPPPDEREPPPARGGGA